MMLARFDIPTTLPSRANLREHWAVKHGRESKLRRDAATLTRALLSSRFKDAVQRAGARIVLTRIASRRLDKDNNVAAMKPIQDGIADGLGMNDGSSRLDWDYAQESGYPDRVAVAVECADVFTEEGKA